MEKNLVLVITKKSFKNDKGENVSYFDFSANVFGADIRFVPKADDKSLLKFVLEQHKFDDNGNLISEV